MSSLPSILATCAIALLACACASGPGPLGADEAAAPRPSASASAADAGAPQEGVANAQKPASKGKPAGSATPDADARTSGHAAWMTFVNEKLDTLSAGARKTQSQSK